MHPDPFLQLAAPWLSVPCWNDRQAKVSSCDAWRSLLNEAWDKHTNHSVQTKTSCICWHRVALLQLAMPLLVKLNNCPRSRMKVRPTMSPGPHALMYIDAGHSVRYKCLSNSQVSVCLSADRQWQWCAGYSLLTGYRSVSIACCTAGLNHGKLHASARYPAAHNGNLLMWPSILIWRHTWNWLAHTFLIDPDLDFQSPVSYGHDPQTEKDKVKRQLVQKKTKWKQMNGQTWRITLRTRLPVGSTVQMLQLQLQLIWLITT